MANIDHVGVDLVRHGPEVTQLGDVTALPLESSSFDALICIHVLEHVVDDRAAIAELFRVLRPGGWALITVPLRLDRRTHEDPSVTDPKERERQFGERSHVRFYGVDLLDRLRAAGFTLRLDPASEIDPATRARHGLRDDENVLHCLRPMVDPPATGGQPKE
jgi:SAM-dependent methyltransferase